MSAGVNMFGREPIIEIDLPVRLTNQNTGKAHRWLKSRIREQFSEELRLEYSRKPFAHPVCLLITRRLGQGERIWDTDAVAIASKQLLDTLVELDWFRDDSFEWIKAICYTQDKDQRHAGSGVIVSVYRWG